MNPKERAKKYANTSAKNRKKNTMLRTMVMVLPYPTGRVARKEECRGQAGLVHVCAAQPTLPICTLLACACCEALPGILTLVLHVLC